MAVKESPLNFTLLPLLVALLLFAAMLVLLELGRRLGARRLARDPDGRNVNLGTVEGAIFALMGLLVAFTFSGASARLDIRRAQIVEESNAIGTAWLRIDLLPASAQPAVREKFRRYLDARMDAFKKFSDPAASNGALARSVSLQNEIWALAVTACRESPPQTSILVLPALNAMIDMSATRTMTARIHPPPIVHWMLGALALIGSLLAGYGMAASKTRTWLYIVVFAGIMAFTIYVILDLEFPRAGLIRIDAFDHVFADLRRSMGA
jgi:hypothetical protein